MSDSDHPILHGDGDAGDDSYLASLSDLMVGMLFIFIIMLMAFALSYTSATGTAVSKSKALECLLTQNQKELQALLTNIGSNVNQKSGGAVKIEVDPNNQALRLNEGDLFNTGSFILLPGGRTAIDNLATELNALRGAEQIIEAVYIEGHTDNVPFTGSSNWALSTARAISTYDELKQKNPDLDNMKNTSQQKLFAVSGYGEWRPIASNASEEGRRKNRRIDIRFALRVPTADEVKTVMAMPHPNKNGC